MMPAPTMYKCGCGYLGPCDRGFCPRCKAEFTVDDEQPTRTLVSNLLNDLPDMELEECGGCGSINLV